MDPVVQEALTYTRAELSRYATITDLSAVRDESYTNRARIDWLEQQHAEVIGTIGTIEPTIRTAPDFVEQFRHIEEEVRQIKAVLIDVQMMLQALGLDDMSNRIGDLDMLLL